jgi:Rps23 Pro-64 3,4-dihydroxylase Tpa1-like proline 4-hydroxylase
MEFMRNMSGHKLTSTVDIAATRYTDTNYLLCHDDKLDSRKIAFLVYLTDMTPVSGGALALYSAKKGKPHKVVERIFPQKGTFACFDVSAISYHEVEEVLGKHARVAIGGWYHVA